VARAGCARPDRAPVVLPVRDAVLAARTAPSDQGHGLRGGARGPGRLDRAARADDAGADRGPTPVDARGPDEPVEHPRRVPGSERGVRRFPGRCHGPGTRRIHHGRSRRRPHALVERAEPGGRDVARARIPDDRRRPSSLLDGPAVPGRDARGARPGSVGPRDDVHRGRGPAGAPRAPVPPDPDRWPVRGGRYSRP
jgi:hypothetical protein